METQKLTINDLSKGLNTFDPASRVPAGYYVDAQNMVLTNKTPITVGGLTKFNTTPAPNDEAVVWFEPYTTSAGITTMLVATDAGSLYKYTQSTDTWTVLRKGLSTTATAWTHVPFRGKLLFTNGVDPVFKYDGDQVIPLGSKSITDFSDGTWTNGVEVTSPLLAGDATQQVVFGRAETVTLKGVLPEEVDLQTGIDGATDFGDDDVIQFKMYVADATPWNPIGSNQKDYMQDGSASTWVLLGYGTGAEAYEWAFKFVPTSSYTISQIMLNLQVIGTPAGNVSIQIQTDNAGLPSNTTITNGTSIDVSTGDMPTTQWSETPFRFTTPPSVTSGTTYWLVVTEDWTPSTSDHVRIRQRTTVANSSKVNTSAAPTTWAAGATSTTYITDYRILGASSTVELRLASNGTTDYYSGLVQDSFSNGWNTVQLRRAEFGATGSPSWSGIQEARFVLTPRSATTVTFDDLIIKYAESVGPPVGSLIELYAQQCIIAGIEDDPVAIRYSDAGTPDYFPADNVARFSGGRHALEKRDQITSLRSYFDELIVGKVNSAWTFSGTGSNTSISALPLTIGIDAHRGVVETPWSLQYLFENNIFGARLTSRGLVSSNINSLLLNIDGQELDNTVSIRHDRSHTVRWAFRTTDATADQNDLGLIYDYQLDAWTSKYTPRVSYYTRAVVDGNREILCAQYDGYIRRVDVGSTFDGTPIESYITLPYMQTEAAEKQDNVVRWVNGTFYVRGTGTVLVEARFADEPHEFSTASFTTYGSIAATPDGDKGFVYFGPTARWIQVRLRATAGSFEVLLPMLIGYLNTSRRV